MSKVIKTLLLFIYVTLITQYIRLLLMPATQEVVLELEYLLKNPALSKKVQTEMMKKNKKNISVIIHFKFPERLPTDLKYILKYTDAFLHKISLSKSGQDEFIQKKCKYINCYLTTDKNMLFDLHYYDAILFDVENTWDYFPVYRSPHQRYIFVASESAQNNPLCHQSFDNFYNLTWTYRLDSDIKWTFFTIYDKNGTVVGPSIDMKWEKLVDPIPKTVKDKFENKKKAAAWLVSNCKTTSNRHVLYEHLQVEFLKNNMSIDIYGWCGKRDCPLSTTEDCLDAIGNEYYFYLALENSLSEDYVTEKVLHGFLHFTVPIVYGGANYSRFLPPGSYINAFEETPENVVALVKEAMQDRTIYENYFRWHNYYVYKKTDDIGDVCALCEQMNTPQSNRAVKNFRQWWYPDYTKQKDCYTMTA